MKTSKTAAAATVSLYVAVLGLLTAVLTLAGAAVRLLAAGLQALTARLQRATVPAPVQAPPAGAQAPARPNLRVVPAPAPEPLVTALVGLGFKAPEVRRFVATLGPRAGTERLEDLIKEGLRALAS
jgi:hypothetical protein